MAQIRPVEHVFEGLTLRGTAYVPDNGATSHPTVILHHGFGSTRLEAFGLFVQISRALADRGILAVAFDRAGHGESDGAFFDTTLSGDIATGVALVRAVSEWPEVQSENVHLLGMSLGAVVASIIAVDAEVQIASLTMISPAAVFVDEIRSGTLQGRSLDEVKANGYFDFNSARLGPEFINEAREFDVYGRAQGFGGSVRIIHGDADHIVPVDYALRYQDVYGEMADITIIRGGDHMWSAVTVRDTVLREVIDFLVRQVDVAVSPTVRR